jgi:hypothetical protein
MSFVGSTENEKVKVSPGFDNEVDGLPVTAAYVPVTV